MSALGIVRIYRDDSNVPVVYENVKHEFWVCDNTVYCIAQVTDAATGEHRYVRWPRERICWTVYEKPAKTEERP